MSTKTENTTNNEVAPKRLTKTAIWENAQELLKKHKADDKLVAAMEALLKPKAGGGSSQNPPKLDKDGNIVEAYCRYHECYEPVANMVTMTKDGKTVSKGYCRAGASVWNGLQSQAKAEQAKANDELVAGNFEAAQKHAKKSEALKKKAADHKSYDLTKDWAEFNKTTEETK